MSQAVVFFILPSGGFSDISVTDEEVLQEFGEICIRPVRSVVACPERASNIRYSKI